MFSVVIPLYNKEISINKTLKSVLNQTFKNFEIVLVNDGSTDGSLEAAKSIEDSRIRIIEQQNGGVSSARNRGIKEARYEWILFLDADDFWTIDHLETIREMQNLYPQDYVFCTSFVRNNQKSPTVDSSEITVIKDYFTEAIKYHFFWTSVTCINKIVFEKVGYFQKIYSRGEDLDLWMRIGRSGFTFIKSKKITGIYNVDTENKITQSKFNYNTSFLNSIHRGMRSFKSKSEKDYLLKVSFDSVLVFLRRCDISSSMKTIYRYFIILIKPVQNEK
ncbi:glycosyltransferase family 2 protein [Sphingobacterium siyangense]|uniref:glycosyltransferase family 2 protein n=1 Tax=Sphingobacterium siyangense TaxID=459529 RepID=UPI003DA270F0